MTRIIRRIICFFRGHRDFEAIPDDPRVWCAHCGKQVKEKEEKEGE